MKRSYLGFAVLLFAFFASTGAMAQVSVVETQSHGPHLWSYGFFSLASTEFDQQNEGGGRFSAYNYLTAARKLDWSHRLAIRLPFTYETAGYDQFDGERVQNQNLQLEDIFVSLTDYHLALLPGDIGVYWDARVYAPTSKYSRNTKMIARLRNEFILSKYLTKNWIIEYDQKFNYYVQSRTTYDNHFVGSDGFDVDTVSLTKQAVLDHWLDTWYMVHPQFGFGFELGWKNTWWNHSAVYNKSKAPEHLWKLGPEVKFALSNRASFIFSIENQLDPGKEPGQLGRFRAKDTQAVLMSFISL